MSRIDKTFDLHESLSDDQVLLASNEKLRAAHRELSTQIGNARQPGSDYSPSNHDHATLKRYEAELAHRIREERARK
jgi:hypothetical protein